MQDTLEDTSGLEIAVIGMAGQFPGAQNISEFWQMLVDGEEGLSSFTDQQLLDAGIPKERINQKNYVKRKGIFEGCYNFDHQFFGYSAREAALMDPQLRKFHQLVYWSLDDAGYAAATKELQVGVFAGAGNNPFWLMPYLSSMANNFSENYEISSLNGREFLATRTAYKLGLTGPAITFQTACSTSLVAVHFAVQSLLAGECEVALAGGVAIYTGIDRGMADKSGYEYQEGMILSPDGHCRAFDSAAQGTVLGDGMGMLALKRLEDALLSGDHIYAVIKGTSVNNDGNDKAGYTAPSVSGQEQVIRQALQVAEVEPDSIGYVEAHGTGTKLGDPIEIQALNRVYGDVQTDVKLGSVKTNIGHLDAAAGISGLIKSILSVQNQIFLPSLHYQSWNPEIPHGNGPFKVQIQAEVWQQSVRRAAVSSFGIGGTNAHVILENAPTIESHQSVQNSVKELLVWSGKTMTSANKYIDKLAQHLANSDCSNVAYSLACKRPHYAFRRAVIAHNKDSAIEVLSAKSPNQIYIGQSVEHEQLVFLFPGQGSQYAGMAKALYQDNSAFRENLDDCLSLLARYQDFDYRSYLLNEGSEQPELETQFAQPLIFAVEYSLGKTLLYWGVNPDFCIGHSLGEYTCACLSGMLQLQDAITLVIHRARLMNSAPGGSMLAVSLEVNQIKSRLEGRFADSLEIAAINAKNNVVVAGDRADILTFKQALEDDDVVSKVLKTSHAFHSHSMECILDDFQDIVSEVIFSKPNFPWISSMSGQIFDADNLPDAQYWRDQIRQPVLFAEAVTWFAKKKTLFLEVGPGKALSGFVRNNETFAPGRHNTAALLEVTTSENIDADLDLKARLYVSGVDLPWESYFADKTPRYCPLPGYVFDEHEFRPSGHEGLNPAPVANADDGSLKAVQQQWQEVNLLDAIITVPSQEKILLLVANGEQHLQVLNALQAHGNQVAIVHCVNNVHSVNSHEDFQDHGQQTYTLNPLSLAHWRQLGRTLSDWHPQRIIDLWPLSKPELETGAKRNLFLAQGFLSAFQKPLTWHLVGQQIYSVSGDSTVDLNTAYLYPCVRVLSQEIQTLSTSLLDFNLSLNANARRNAEILLQDIARSANDSILSRSRKKLWRPEFFATLEVSVSDSQLRSGGTYLITGGSGGIGLELAVYLAENYQANIILVSRNSEQLAIAHEGVGESQLQKIQGSASSFTTLNCDISNQQDVVALGDWIKQSSQRIDGFFHAAGVAGRGLHHTKTTADLNRVLAPKVAGTQHLLAMLTAQELTPDFVMLFSSITSWLGGVGQYEYAIANQYLDKVAAANERDYPVLSMNWDTWRDVGMMTNGKPRNIHQKLWLTKTEQTDLQECHYSGDLEVNKVWALNEHLVYGIPTMPGAAYMSLVVSNLLADKESPFPLHISEAYFMQPFALEFNDKATLSLSAQATTDKQWYEGYQFELASDKPFGQKTVHCQGKLGLSAKVKIPPAINLDVLQQRSDNKVEVRAGLSLLQQLQVGSQGSPENDALNAIELGPRWDVLKEVYSWQDNGLAWFELPEQYLADLETVPLHPALLDCATAFMRVMGQTDAYLPVAYHEMLLYQAIPARFWSWCQRLTDTDDNTLAFKVSIYDPNGEPVATVERFMMRKVSLTKVVDKQQTETRERLLAGAISTEEAWPFLEMALAQPSLSDMMITRKDVKTALAYDDLNLSNMIKGDDKRFPRPDLMTPFKAAKKPQQKKLTQYLEALLGLEQVGLDDDFFDLGGNSLQLTQFHKFLSQELNKEIDVTSLFQHTSVSEILRLFDEDKAAAEEASMNDVKTRAQKQKVARQARRQRRHNPRD